MFKDRLILDNPLVIALMWALGIFFFVVVLGNLPILLKVIYYD